MINSVTLGTVTHARARTHTQCNLINDKKHKDMMYLCNFGIFKII